MLGEPNACVAKMTQDAPSGTPANFGRPPLRLQRVPVGVHAAGGVRLLKQDEHGLLCFYARHLRYCP